MKRIIKEFNSLTDQHYHMIREQYPKGFVDNDLVTLKTANGQYFDALEVRTGNAIYLVKVNHEMLEKLDQIEEINLGEEFDQDLTE